MKLVEIGRVSKPHGVRGEMKVRLHWPSSDTLFAVRTVTIDLDGRRREIRIESARGGAGAVLLKLDGVDDRDAAGELRGAGVCVRRDELPALEDGDYYLCDLVGARVVAGASEIGRVIDVVTHPTIDSLVIRAEDGKRLEQPMSPHWVVRVDPAAGVVELASVEGLV